MSAVGKARIGLVQFPGSNCDMDVVDTLGRHFGLVAKLVSHAETSLPPVDAVVLPGGFSYGDYLRSGALASHAPIMGAVKSFVRKGGPVLGICNGFQILTEAQLLPGALLRNAGRKFVCEYVTLTPGKGTSAYHAAFSGKRLRLPIAHGEGRYYIDLEGLKRLQQEGCIALRYMARNPNGSCDDIAGIVSKNGRVMGLMPHPERATDTLLGDSDDGLVVWQAFLASFM